jgi:hypothetical protein
MTNAFTIYEKNRRIEGTEYKTQVDSFVLGILAYLNCLNTDIESKRYRTRAFLNRHKSLPN